MTDPFAHDPTARFSGLAGLYARHRPGYPAQAVALIMDCCGLGGADLLVDVGCGTGISTRLFAARGVRVLGIEPNDDMRALAEAAAPPPGGPALEYRPGRAEATGLPDGVAAAVLAAQSFHWFDAPAALREFHRILRPGGRVALVWNERDEADPCTAAYGAVMRSAPEAADVEVPRSTAGQALLGSHLFEDAECLRFVYRQELDEEGLLGRAFSASYAPRDPAGSGTFADDLRRVFARFQQGGKVALCYETTVYLARRKGGPAAC
jgi:SAM-dependent methyltransferase